MFGSMRLASRVAAVGAVAVVAGAGVAGCSSASSSPIVASPVISTTASSPAGTSAAASTSPPGLQPEVATPSTSATSAAGAPDGSACASMDLGAHVGLAQGTAGSIYQVIYFTNLSNTPCTLYGYPGVSLAAGSSQVNQVGAAAARSTATAATVVTLDAGQSANATLRIVEAGNYPTGTCQPTPTTFLQIFPPGQTTPIYLAYKSTGCASSAVNLLSVSVMTAGTGG
jgi:Protein of unknown function (DUF4232)